MEPSKKPGALSSEFVQGSLIGGGILALATQTITPEMGLGAGLAVGMSSIGMAAIAIVYAMMRTEAKR